jgi:hypothetical protein
MSVRGVIPGAMPAIRKSQSRPDTLQSPEGPILWLVIIEGVFRRFALFVAASLLLVACSSRIQSKEKVQQAIIDRLQSRSGLDLKTLDVTTTSVTFDKNLAYATVAFHPKDDPTVNGGMTMKYTLEERSGHWVVLNVGDSQGHSTTGHASPGQQQLPPGHPSLDPRPLDPSQSGSTGPHARPRVKEGANGQVQ